MADKAQATMVALAVGVPLMYAGLYALKHINPNLALRTAIGCALLIAGIILADTLANGSGALYLHPIRLGVAIALLGLGINQASAPLRAALGKSA